VTGSGLPASPGRPWDRELADLGCGALLILAESARDPDLAHHTGAVHVGTALLVLPAGGAPRLGYFSPMERDEAAATGLGLLHPTDLDLPRARREGWPGERVLSTAAMAALAVCGVEPGRVAVAGRGPTGERHAACRHLEEEGWTVVPGDEAARRLRKTKGPDQLAAVRRAAAGTVAAYRAVAEALAAARGRGGGEPAPGDDLRSNGEPLTVGRLRRLIAVTLAQHGLEQPAGNIVAPGGEAAVPHSAGRNERVLRAGEALVVDLYPMAAPCFADCTRTFCVGEPPAALRTAHAAVRDALALAHRGAVPGVRGWDLQLDVCRELEARGYVTMASQPESVSGYVHNLGHGVGCELHEYPSFRRSAGSEGVLAPGDVLTLEPGLYDPEAGWGVRLEDLVVLGEDGELENLTPLPYELDPRAWAADTIGLL
jgi:Xaa-Pro aminopeptidase